MGRPRLLNTSHTNTIQALIERQHTIYLDEIQDKLAEIHGIHASIPTISRVIRRLNFTRKTTSARALERNELNRSIYMNRIAGLASDPDMLMFVDEAARNRRTSARTQGWARRGARCVQRRFFVRGQRYSILPILTLDGIITYDIIHGSVTSERFLKFLREFVMPLTNPYPGPRSILVLDNCAIHHSEEIRALVEDEAYTNRVQSYLYILPILKYFFYTLTSPLNFTRFNTMASGSKHEDESDSGLAQQPSDALTLRRSLSLKVLATLTRHPSGSKKTKGSGPKKKTKSKDFLHKFSPDAASYVSFLNAILEKQGESKYTFTESRHYSLKVLVPPERAASRAIDIDNVKDWEGLNTSLRTAAKKPTQVQVFVDMNEVISGWNHGGDDSDSDDEPEEAGGVTEEERAIARFRGLLEKEYGTDHDASYAYVGKHESFPLTPLMMSTWARAMYDGKATISQYPNLEMFDPRNRRAILNPNRPSPVIGSAPASPSDSSSFAANLESFTAMIKAAAASAAQPPSSTVTQPPTTPAFEAPLLTPSKLRRYLEYARDNLGVARALEYHESLERHGYGPDILHRVEDAKLLMLGMSDGIRKNAMES
ncbi:hypothetical protein ONZ45_g8604 [Pleurotus djamor]|nr:hypothetical protein ONZ45_g8604 [Pleurotus djamor]